MDFLTSTQFGSLFAKLAASKGLFIIFLIGAFLVFNFILIPTMKKNRKMEKLFYDRLEKMPTPEEFMHTCENHRIVIIEQIRLLLAADSAETRVAISEATINFEKFYAKILTYEERLGVLIDSIDDMSDEVKDSNEGLSRDINLLIQIREEMIALLEVLIKELEDSGVIKPIDKAPLERIRYLIKFSDKYIMSKLQEHGIISDSRTSRSGELDRLFDVRPKNEKE
jgi:hypothetical protein